MLTLKTFKQKLASEGKVRWQENLTTEFLWSYEMHSSKAHLWNYLSDTSRLNREMGFAARNQVEQGGKLLVSAPMLGLAQEWIEEPWTWIAEETLGTVRNYSKGMAKKMQSVFYIDSTSIPGQCTVYIYFGWQPKNAFWKLFLKMTESVLQKGFAKALTKIDQMKPSERNFPVFRANPEPLNESILNLAQSKKAELQALGLKSESIDCLLDLVLNGDEMDVEPIRVLQIAQKNEMNERDLLTTCLHATQKGILTMSWDVICPHCRSSRYSARTLGDIPADSNCEVCDLDFSTGDENAIEVLFHVHSSIREIAVRSYCAAEPAKKSHITIQQSLQPGESFATQVNLSPGLYRARKTGEAWNSLIEVSDGSSRKEIDLNSTEESFEVSPSFQLKFKNTSVNQATFVIESVSWNETSLKPSHVLALPQFRDLFSEQHLSSNVKLYLGEQAILFTDIVGSTRFYRDLGDAKAFAEVRSHFQEVFQEIKAHRGVVVKTIGDAVMASFPTPAESLEAAIAIQKKFHQKRTDTLIRLRVSVHSGPVIAVQLNTGLDYFGNTVNTAAKIQSCAGSGEIAFLSTEYRKIASQKFSHFEILKRQNSREGLVMDVDVLQVLS